MPKTSFSELKRTPPRKPTNAERRHREHLTEAEVKRLETAAGSMPPAAWRDAALVLVMFRHGLRVSEALALRWEMLDVDQHILHVSRRKNGVPTTHPVTGREIRLLRQWQKNQVELCHGEHPPHVFTTSRTRGGTVADEPLSPRAVYKIIARAGIEAGFDMPIHPHMLRHSCGYYLASKGVDTRAIQLYLGHKDIRSTEIYTALAPNRFNEFWKD